jgi:HTH-type transcriptional regulator/antitoxin HigA
MTSDQEPRIWPDIAIPPGEFLQETIDELGMTQTELAKRAGISLKTINQIIKGKEPITEGTAFALERALGTPSSLWVNLDRNYQYNRARLENLARLKLESSRLSGFPIREAVKLGWLRRFSNQLEQTQELLSFLGVASFDNLPRVQAFAFRKSATKTACPQALALWLRQGQIEARKIENEPYHKARFQDCLSEARRMTREGYPQGFNRLRKLLSACGVAAVAVPHLPKSYVSGAAYWLKPDLAVIQLSLRFRRDDQFWFSFFHEAGHILLHGKKQVFLDYETNQGGLEDEANRFAAEILIPPSSWKKFAARRGYDAGEVSAFAREIGVAPGIVVGRLQREKLVPYHSPLNRLKRSLA